MESQGAPWIEVPDDWLDAEYSSDPEIAKIQQFLDKKVKAEVIRKHLLAEGIGEPGDLEIEKLNIRSYGRKCIIEAKINVTGQAWKVKDETTGLYVDNNNPKAIKTGIVKMIRSIEKDDSGTIYAAIFGKIGVGTARLPDDFGDEYYKIAIPLLRKIGVTPLETVATTEADNPKSDGGRLSGAYVWCKYGYTNGVINKKTGQVEVRIGNTIDELLKYLKDDRKLKLSNDEIDDIKSIKRMIDLVSQAQNRKERKKIICRQRLPSRR